MKILAIVFHCIRTVDLFLKSQKDWKTGAQYNEHLAVKGITLRKTDPWNPTRYVAHWNTSFNYHVIIFERQTKLNRFTKYFFILDRPSFLLLIANFNKLWNEKRLRKRVYKYNNLIFCCRGFLKHPKIDMFYSTPSCYIKAINDFGPVLKLKTDDFFPYSDDSHNFWTGYFSSRPTNKRLERVGHNILQVSWGNY